MQKIKTSLPIPSGGLHPGKAAKILNDLGFDCALSAGGAIHGHPMGAEAGARAFRQEIDAVIKDINIEEYASEHEELKAALDKWT